MGYEKTKDEKSRELKKLLREFGIDFPTTRRNCLYTHPNVRVQEIDLTQEIFDPDQGKTADSRRRCSRSRSIDLGGWAVTDGSGQRVWKLSEFVCDADSRLYRRPVSFVATALSETPVSMTVSVQSTGNDLIVEVRSWDASGDPAPRVAFSWRCWAEATGGIAAGPGPWERTQPPEQEEQDP